VGRRLLMLLPSYVVAKQKILDLELCA